MATPKVQKRIILLIGILVAATTFISPFIGETFYLLYLIIESCVFFALYLIWMRIDQKVTGYRLNLMAKVGFALPGFIYYLFKTRKKRAWKSLGKAILYTILIYTIEVVGLFIANAIGSRN